ncbi:MAG: hypothetical protein ACW99A_15425 [Candidatus Kariarchaeaceae archaeon]|jgi:hypothetical protein
MLLLFTILILASFVNADDHEEDEGDDENDDESEFGEKLGVGAIGLLGVGGVYIFVRRGVILFGNYRPPNDDLVKSMKRLFAKFRPQLLMLHQIFMVLATIAAIIHGLTVTREFESREIFGWAAAITMSVISILGMLMWKQLRPFLKKIDMFTPIRFIHRQLILSVLLLIFLAFHLI